MKINHINKDKYTMPRETICHFENIAQQQGVDLSVKNYCTNSEIVFGDTLLDILGLGLDDKFDSSLATAKLKSICQTCRLCKPEITVNLIKGTRINRRDYVNNESHQPLFTTKLINYFPATTGVKVCVVDDLRPDDLGNLLNDSLPTKVDSIISNTVAY